MMHQPTRTTPRSNNNQNDDNNNNDDRIWKDPLVCVFHSGCRPTDRANNHNHNTKEGTLTVHPPLPLSNSSTYSNSINPFLHSLFV